MVLGKLFGHLIEILRSVRLIDKVEDRVHKGKWLRVRMICFAQKGSHRALLRIIHAIVIDAHHAFQNGENKRSRWTLTLRLLPVRKEREEHHPPKRGRRKVPRLSALSTSKESF